MTDARMHWCRHCGEETIDLTGVPIERENFFTSDVRRNMFCAVISALAFAAAFTAAQMILTTGCGWTSATLSNGNEALINLSNASFVLSNGSEDAGTAIWSGEHTVVVLEGPKALLRSARCSISSSSKGAATNTLKPWTG